MFKSSFLLTALCAAIFLFLFSHCQRSQVPDPAELEFISDDEGWEIDSLDVNTDTASGGKITFEYLNNETEIFRPSTWTVKLWRFESEPIGILPLMIGNEYITPAYTVSKPANGKCYIRRIVKAGWYLAEYEGTGQFFKFYVATDSDGLLVYNEHDYNSYFRGYFPNYGKIKFSWKKAPPQDANIVLDFLQLSTIWMYAEDGEGIHKSQFWFVPANQYVIEFNRRSIYTIVAPGKAYPHFKI